MAKRRAEDQSVRDVALDTGKSFIVRAPAGSGKTRLLIQRYLALLARVDEPEEIVAITFTRKAAAEMRERVLAALSAVNDTAVLLDEQTGMLARAALARDAERGWQIAANASRLRIQTIDALNASITRQVPLAARFGAQPDSVDDAMPLYREAARALLAEVNEDGDIAADVATLLAHLDNHLGVVEALLAEMLRTRDHWLRSLPMMHQREVLEASLGRVRAAAARDVTRLFPQTECSETLELASLAGRKWPEERANAWVLLLAELHEWPGDSATALPKWLALGELLLTKDGGWRKRLDKNVGFPTSKEKREKAELDAVKARMTALLERLDGSQHGDQLAVSLNGLRFLPPASYTDAQWEVLGAIVRLLPVATALLWTVFGVHGQCDFTEIAQSASRALGDDDAPSDLALALDYRIHHLLVDEFQDTSFAQFELLEKLTRGWSDGDGRTLLVVGDPMQSIYRFREAEVGLFLRAMHRGIGEIALEPLKLTVNFRSEPGIVDWVNRTFRQLMPGDADPDAGKVPHAASVAHAESSGESGAAVSWHPLVVRKVDGTDVTEATQAGAEEARRVAAIIAAAQCENPRGDIALLVRNRGHLADIVPALKNAGIAFRAVDIDPLKKRPAVEDLLALARAILHPADRIAWLAILRAPWCGLSLADLAVLTNGALPVDGALAPDPRTVWEMLNDAARLPLLSAAGVARAGAICDVLRPALAMRRRRPLRDLVETTWLALRGPACLPSVADLDDTMLLFDLIESEAQEQTGGTHIADLQRLDARVEKLYADNRVALQPGAPPPLQIMTIHKAKGLEFDTVIVPGLDRIPRTDERKLLVWNEQPDPDTGQRELLLAPIRETGETEETDAIYRYVQQRDRDKQQQEDVRLLYVAATRAKRRLHLLGSVVAVDKKGELALSAPRGGSLLASLWPAVESVFQAALTASAMPADATVARTERDRPATFAVRLADAQPLPRMPLAVTPFAAVQAPAASANIDFEWAGETARHVGTVVHGLMQRLAEDELVAWDRDRIVSMRGAFEADLRAAGVPVAELSGAAERVAEALVNTLEDARGRWLLGAHRQARSEWRLTGAVPGGFVNVAIDRTFVDDAGNRWIVDYKTGSHEGGNAEAFLDAEQNRYRPQLDQYARLLQAMRAGALDKEDGPIRLGLYFPLLSAWREWTWVPN